MAALNRSSSISTRAATHDDVPLLSALEAACEPPSRRLGATVLNHRRQHHFIATEAGPSHHPIGALLTLRLEHLHELIEAEQWHPCVRKVMKPRVSMCASVSRT